MGVVNVTPDSFSDGGQFDSVDEAVAEGLAHSAEGAHLVDIGGASTRPGAEPVAADEERRRVMPVIERLVEEGVAVSVDTSKPSVAESAIAAGAIVVNDVNGLRTDGMASVCADGAVGVVVAHMLGDPRTMQEDPTYGNVVAEVRQYLQQRLNKLGASGIPAERIAIDPGIGFGKTLSHNLELLSGIGDLVTLGRPVLIGTSRKRFLGTLTGRPVDQRDVVTAASVGMAVVDGASIVRVHNVPFAADAVAFADAMVRIRKRADGDQGVEHQTAP